MTMLEKKRSVKNEEYRGLPTSLIERGTMHNALWGLDYFVFLDKSLNEDEAEQTIENMILSRFLRI